MKRFLRDNGLSLVLFGSFLVLLLGQIVTGRWEYNEDRRERGDAPVNYQQYLRSGHFVEATMENWESEFLQMSAYVLLTVFLFQRGAADSKDPDDSDDLEDGSGPRRDSPSPVRRGGWRLLLYQNSLSLALFAIFVASFALHASGGAAAYNEDVRDSGRPVVSAVGYLATSRFWFESFQNWQREFFSIGVMTVLSIFLRQKGSPESKPLASPHRQTGSAG
jgi:hypothetical protein